jgi:hypothetical protein
VQYPPVSSKVAIENPYSLEIAFINGELSIAMFHYWRVILSNHCCNPEMMVV